MDTDSRESRATDGSRLERAIVLQVLRQDREQRWPRAELASELDVDAQALYEALERLVAHGVICLDEDQLWASAAARRLDELGLLAI